MSKTYRNISNHNKNKNNSVNGNDNDGDEEEKKIFRLNPFFRPISERDKIRIKLLKTKFKPKININNTSYLKSLNISKVSKDEKDLPPFNKRKIDKSIINKYKSLINDKKKTKNNNSILILRNKNNMLNKYKLLKKNNSTETIFNKSKFKKSEDLTLKRKKNELKKRLIKNMQKHFIIDKETFHKYNLLFKIGIKRKGHSKIDNLDNIDEQTNNNSDNYDNKNESFDNKNTYKKNYFDNFYTIMKSTYRYEDYYFTPIEFLHKYFTDDEIYLMKSFPSFFGFNKTPFKKTDLIFKPTLLQKIEHEDKLKPNHNKTINIDKHITKFFIKNEKTKIKKKVKSAKIVHKKTKNDKKKEKIKCKPFVSNYERDIEPNEGTVEYFEEKYQKYLRNKIKRLKEKFDNYHYKKMKYAFLKNQNAQKNNTEFEIQRQTKSIIETIRNNYTFSNYINKHQNKL